jgi:hypothetical protein
VNLYFLSQKCEQKKKDEEEVERAEEGDLKGGRSL